MRSHGFSVDQGLGIDLEKDVWLDDVKGMLKVIVAGSHDAYSDTTGGQPQSILPQCGAAAPPACIGCRQKVEGRAHAPCQAGAFVRYRAR